MHGRRSLRLDGDHAPVRCGRSDSRDEPATARRHQDRLHLGRVFEQLERERALAGHHERVVERMHECPAGLADVLVEAGERLDRVGRLEVDRGTVTARRFHLGRAGAGVHDDQAVDPLGRRAPGEGLGVVSGRDPDHASSPLFRAERGELVHDAAGLERARLLEELRLQPDLVAECARCERRRAVDATVDPLRRSEHVVAGHRHRSIVDSSPWTNIRSGSSSTTIFSDLG